MFAYSNFHVENPPHHTAEMSYFKAFNSSKMNVWQQHFHLTLRLTPIFCLLGQKRNCQLEFFLLSSRFDVSKQNSAEKNKNSMKVGKGRTCDGSVIDMWLEHPVPSTTHLCLYRRHADQTMTWPKCACFSQFSLLLFILISSVSVSKCT